MRSIIEKIPTPDDHTIARCQPLRDGHLVAKAVLGPDLSYFEMPRARFDEDAVGVVLQHESCGRNSCNGFRRRDEPHTRKHSWFEATVRIAEFNPDLRASGIRVDRVADACDRTSEDLPRISQKSHLDSLPE